MNMFEKKSTYERADAWLVANHPREYAREIVERSGVFVVSGIIGADDPQHRDELSQKYGVFWYGQMDGFFYARFDGCSDVDQILRDRWELLFENSGDPMSDLIDIYTTVMVLFRESEGLNE